MSAAPQPLAPDALVIQEFYDWWFHYANRGEVQIGWRSAVTGNLTEFRTFQIGDDDFGEAVAAINSVPGQSCYVRAATIRAGLGSTAAADSDFVQAPGPWGDLDDAGAYMRAQNVEAIIRPSAWVETGRHPHWRAQGFWRMEGPCENPVAIEAMNKRIVSLYGGDSSVTNPTRLMRLPGTIAWPSKPGRVPELTKLIVPTGRPRLYNVEMLHRLLPQETAPAPITAAAPAHTGGLVVFGQNSAAAHLARIKAGDQWHNNMVRLVAHWIGRGWSNAEILAAAEAFTLPGYTHSQTVAEVSKAIEGGRKKWGVADQEHNITSEGPATPFEGAPYDPWDALRPLIFPMDTLPPELAAFASARARAIGCDPAAIAMAALSALSVALDGRSRLRLKQHDFWSVPPSLWVALIGSSSARKSPAIRAAWAPLERRQAEILGRHANQMAFWKSMPKEDRGEPPPPPLRYVSHDATMEALQGILSNQSRGLGVIRDELAGFIGALEKYSGGKGGAADRAFFLEAFDGGPHTVDRVGRGTVSIDNLLLALCGGIQPDRLLNFGDLTDDGLWQRFIPVIMGPPSIGQDVPSGADEAAYDDLVGHVVGLPSLRAVLTADARAERERMERKVFDLETSDALGGAFSSFLGKLHGLWGRLCLVLHAATRDADAETVEGHTARQASRLIFDYIIPSAARVYVAMGAGAGKADPTRDVAGYILTKKLERLLASDLTRNVRCARGAGLPEVQKLVSPLVAGGWLAPEKDHSGNNAWMVNPQVHELFAARAAREAQRREQTRALIAESVKSQEGDAT